MVKSFITPGLAAALLCASVVFSQNADTANVNAIPKGAKAGTETRLVLTVTAPSEGQRFTKPVIPVAGSVTPGAEVSVSGVKVPVTPAGGFSTQIPIPDEETSLDLSIKASYNGKSKTVTRTVHYAPEVKFSVAGPAQQQVFAVTQIPVQGEVTPAGAVVTVEGTRIPVTSAGRFSGTVTIPDHGGPVDLDFKASYGDGVKNETRTIVYKKTTDQYAPSIQPSALPAASAQKTISFTVVDRTVNDEITFYRETDGSRESEIGAPGGRFTLSLEDGLHDYAVWASDRMGNKTPRISGRIAYLSSVAWNVRVIKPAGSSEIIRIPPSVPREDFSPVYTMRFTVLNLPDDDPRLLREVAVHNTATGATQSERNIADLDFSFDFDLEQNKPNVFTVVVRDINNVEKTASFSVELR